MPTAFERLGQFVEALNAEAVEYAIFGGQAVNLHGILRYTGDIDVFVRPSAENVERLRRALRRIWDEPCIDEIVVEDLAGDYAVVRYGTPDEFVIDITSRIGERFAFDDLEIEIVRVGSVPARVASPRTLYRMKKDTVRPQDHADAAELKRRFDIKD